MAYLTRKELERTVLTKEGNINLDASLHDFAIYVGYKKEGNRNALNRPTYYSVYEGSDITLKTVIDEIKNYGIGRFGIGRGYKKLHAMGIKRTEDLCRVLRNYGLIKGRVKRYKAMPKGWLQDEKLDLFY